MGGRPNLLEAPGAKELCITSDDLFWMQKPPGKTLVIGAGYIAMECSGLLKMLGFDVTVLYRSKVLSSFD
jgi:pyruvate/2-oxoglutarate dehydrogenase complex dihydrolipoamide dehydrogenase (E3) component